MAQTNAMLNNLKYENSTLKQNLYQNLMQQKTQNQARKNSEDDYFSTERSGRKIVEPIFIRLFDSI